MKFSKRYLLLFLLLISVASLVGQDLKPRRFYARLFFGPAISFYQNNKNHTASTRPRAAYNFSLKIETKLDKKFSFLFGVEYFIHSFSFDSYYFATGYDYLYDKSFNYKYSLAMSELHAPLLFKLNTKGESKGLRSYFMEFGYVHRYIFLNEMVVKSNATSKLAYAGEIKSNFEYPIANPLMSGFLCIGGGGQFNRQKHASSLFFSVNFKYSLSRFMLKESFAPSSLFIRSHHLTIGVGIRL